MPVDLLLVVISHTNLDVQQGAESGILELELELGSPHSEVSPSSRSGC